MNNSTHENDTLYYDGRCPLCSAEIRWLKKKQRGSLDFIDIYSQREGQLPTSKSLMLQKLHLYSIEKGWLIGLDATVASWKHTPYGCLVAPLRWILIRNVADYCYDVWAMRRYKKRYKSPISCSIPK